MPLAVCTPAPADFYACPSTSGLARTTQGATCGDGQAARHFVDVWAKVTRPTVLGSGFGLPSTLTAHGFTHVADLIGGYGAWLTHTTAHLQET